MADVQKLTQRESTALNIMKAISILSVLAAHLASFSDKSLFASIVSSFWLLFGNIGVIIFFVIGGFLYTRKPNDDKAFWKKKFFRIILPWLVCSLLTFFVYAIETHKFTLFTYVKYIFGSGSLYYYITMYTLFLFIFKYIYNKDKILWGLVGIQAIALTLASFGLSTTLSLGFFTDYLNPLHWIGYFSLGILIKKHRFDLRARQKKHIIIIAYILALLSLCILSLNKIFTYFNILSALFCLASLIIVADISYKLAALKVSKHIATIGTWSYCIYLLHIQIVQFVVWRIPGDMLQLLFAPIIGLGLMVVLIAIALFICNKLPFGQKIKALVGL